MKYFAAILALVTLYFGLIAAWYWLRASKVEAMPLWVKLGQIEPAEPGVAAEHWLIGLMKAGKVAGRLNAIAAKWTAAAVVAGVISIAGTWLL